MVDTWWIWMAGGFVLAILELLAPVFVFLGFAIGAIATGALIWLNGPGSGWMAGSVANHALVFAVLSLAAWALLRALFGLPKGQVKQWDRDINDN